MNKSLSLKYVITLVAFFTSAAVVMTVMMFQVVINNNSTKTVDAYALKINEIEELVNKHYVGELDTETITDYICAGYISGLGDRYAGYITAEDAEASMNDMFGVNMGMGVTISQHPETLNMYVINVHNDSPAFDAGILKGDQIVNIDGNDVITYGYTNALQYIKSRPVDSTIHVKLLRGNETIEVDVLLSNHISQSVFGELKGDYGYILITDFNNYTVDQFKKAVDDMINLGAKALIFDLRGNGGGTLTSVYEMLDYLIPKGLAVRVEYKDTNRNQVYMSDEHEINLPMAVLTDENTASASELFSQGLKDYKKAITVGRNTFGKGVVQRTFTLSDGSLVRFTVGKYYTANGTCLDGVGVVPDVAVTMTEEELSHRIVNGIDNDKDYLAACEYLKGQLS